MAKVLNRKKISYPVFANKKVLYFKFDSVQVFLERSDGKIGFVHRADPDNLLRVGMVDVATQCKIVKIIRGWTK